jgi:hypothetical protein
MRHCITPRPHEKLGCLKAYVQRLPRKRAVIEPIAPLGRQALERLARLRKNPDETDAVKANRFGCGVDGPDNSDSR